MGARTSEDLALLSSPFEGAARGRVPHVRTATGHGRVKNDPAMGTSEHTNGPHGDGEHTKSTPGGTPIAATDALCLSLAVFVAAIAETGRASDIPWPLLVLSPLVGGTAFMWLRLYQSHLLLPAEEFRRLVIGVTLANVTLVTLSFRADVSYSRVWLAMSLALSMLFTLATRRFWRWAVFRECKRDGRFTSHTVIVGTNGEAVRLASALRRPALGFETVGFVATKSAPPANRIRVIGSIRGLAELVASHDIESVFVATTDVGLQEIGAVQKTARRAGIDVHITANLPELLANRIAVEPLGGIMALSLRPVSTQWRTSCRKAGF